MNLKKIVTNVIIAVVVGLAIVNIVGIFFAKQDPLSALKSFPTKGFGVLIVLLALDYLIQAIRTMIFVRFMGYELSFLQSLENFFFTIFFSFVTPMSIGGQPFQIYHLTKNGISSHDATNISIVRMFEGIIIVSIVDIMFIRDVVWILRGTVGLSVIIIGFLVTLGISIAGFLAFVNKDFLYKIFKFFLKFTKSEKIQEKELKAITWLDNMSASTKTLLLKNYWIVLIDIAFGIVVSVISPLMLKISIEYVSNVKVPLTTIWGVISMLNTIVYYVPTPGSSGGIEGFYQMVFSHIYGAKAAMTGIFVFRLVTYYLIIFIGLFLMIRFTRFKEEVESVGQPVQERRMDDNK
ncbi:MAG: lysylphosphatidylglycerol synthase transmembrane domain-containing protein [Fervidobacterium sp.]|uniref:lysylphosphatidylglycerol synthase transmembrane domain-containing protein n=1 Tax=Fervidobacterium sp. TaxID=1871331 RepID=UPI00404AED53